MLGRVAGCLVQVLAAGAIWQRPGQPEHLQVLVAGDGGDVVDGPCGGVDDVPGLGLVADVTDHDASGPRGDEPELVEVVEVPVEPAGAVCGQPEPAG